ncbi:hypothetical protein BKA62DRAFT_721245 [Auriculariales sp. MPI-PUGE-AT-0066]|nr:hypothetical protein BKA62DRAFT_721245 [Auriculariales sp. MPI-PUGE-AT-0066]
MSGRRVFTSLSRSRIESTFASVRTPACIIKVETACWNLFWSPLSSAETEAASNVAVVRFFAVSLSHVVMTSERTLCSHMMSHKSSGQLRLNDFASIRRGVFDGLGDGAQLPLGERVKVLDIIFFCNFADGLDHMTDYIARSQDRLDCRAQNGSTACDPGGEYVAHAG